MTELLFISYVKNIYDWGNCFESKQLYHNADREMLYVSSDLSYMRAVVFARCD
jgi:hypothetical protein